MYITRTITNREYTVEMFNKDTKDYIDNEVVQVDEKATAKEVRQYLKDYAEKQGYKLIDFTPAEKPSTKFVVMELEKFVENGIVFESRDQFVEWLKANGKKQEGFETLAGF